MNWVRNNIWTVLIIAGLVILALTVLDCTKKDETVVIVDPTPTPASSPVASPTPQATPTTTPTPGATSYKVEAAPLWEAARGSEGKAWTQYAMQVIDKEGPAFIDQAQDAKEFCPKYESLDRNKKLNFWAVFLSAIVKHESGFNPLSRMQETTMGKDEITGGPVYSEGLLQLSYQDLRWAKYCQFDWSKDKHLQPKDPKKTILDPYRNLYCGIRIMNNAIAKHKKVAFDSNQYWAVLKPNGKYTKVAQIKAVTQAIPFCK